MTPGDKRTHQPPILWCRLWQKERNAQRKLSIKYILLLQFHIKSKAASGVGCEM
jgi:hypothetical protein